MSQQCKVNDNNSYCFWDAMYQVLRWRFNSFHSLNPCNHSEVSSSSTLQVRKWRVSESDPTRQICGLRCGRKRLVFHCMLILQKFHLPMEGNNSMHQKRRVLFLPSSFSKLWVNSSHFNKILRRREWQRTAQMEASSTESDLTLRTPTVKLRGTHFLKEPQLRQLSDAPCSMAPSLGVCVVKVAEEICFFISSQASGGSFSILNKASYIPENASPTDLFWQPGGKMGGR